MASDVSATKLSIAARLKGAARSPIGTLKWRYEHAREKLGSALENAVVKGAHWTVDRAKIDPRITYPCYMPFDEFIDVERLKSLDVYVNERIERRLRDPRDEKFHTGKLTLEVEGAKLPGSRIIFLTQNRRVTHDYYDVDKAGLREPTADAAEFRDLMEFIATLPFKRTARIIIMYDATGHPVTAHRDHPRTKLLHEFIWFRTNLTKPFYMLNQKTGKRRYVESYSTWFDTCNQFHGVDAKPGLSVSIRVDGTFSDKLRAMIPVPPYNVASTSALWACAGHRTS
jgi:hypothetical protein